MKKQARPSTVVKLRFESFHHLLYGYIFQNQPAPPCEIEVVGRLDEERILRVICDALWDTLSQEIPDPIDLLPSLTDREEKIVAILRTGQLLTSGKCVRLFGVTRDTVARDMKKLMDLGFVTRLGNGRGTKYRLGPKGGPRAPT